MEVTMYNDCGCAKAAFASIANVRLIRADSDSVG